MANSDKQALEVRTHDIPIADVMSEFMKQGWAPSPLSGVTSHQSIPYTKLRREKLSKKYPGIRLVFPAGSLKVRSCLLYTSPSPRDRTRSRMPSSA